MEKVVVLGTAGAVVDEQRDNMSLLFQSEDFQLLLECGGSAAHKLAKSNVAYELLEHIIITHTHVDHVYGLPGLIFALGYRDIQRSAPLNIYCPEEASYFVGALLDLFELRREFAFPIKIHPILHQENALVFENDRVVVTSTPVDHSLRHVTHGVKIFSRHSGKSVVYSADTGPSERLIRLAKHADILFHECCGLSAHLIPVIHSNALQVGRVAQRSEVKQLVLTHLDTILNDAPELLLAEVRQHFTGPASVAADFDEYVL